MKASLYDTVRLLVEVPSEYRTVVLPRGSEGTIVETFSTPHEAYAVDFRVPDHRLVGDYRFENVMVTPEQFDVVPRPLHT